MKPTLIKTALTTSVLGAALLLAPASVLAQSGGAASAGAVPNSFDRPAQSSPSAPTAPVRTGPATSEAMAPDVARSQEALRSVIAAVQGAGFDYSVFTTDMAARMRQLSPEITPMIKSFGAVRTIEFQEAEGEAQLFRVTFDNKVTEWMILFDPEDKIAGLRFRPVEA